MIDLAQILIFWKTKEKSAYKDKMQLKNPKIECFKQKDYFAAAEIIQWPYFCEIVVNSLHNSENIQITVLNPSFKESKCLKQ